MELFSLTTELRTNTGNGPARRVRARGMIPAVFYGRGIEPVSLSVAPKDLTHALTTPYRRNALLKIEIGGETHIALVRELQVHPVTRKPLHVDLYKVDPTRPVVTEVPLASEGRAKGVILGGEVNLIYRSLPVRALPQQIPFEIRVDVTNMTLGDHIRTKDLQLPEGVEVLLDAERSLITCAEPRKLAPEEEEGAPAAGGAAPAATPAAT
jgi:large subunit ribosomal protein L25